MKKYLKYVDIGTVVLSIVSLVMLFVTAISWTNVSLSGEATVTTYSGWASVFGYTDVTSGELFGSTLSVSKEIFKFSFMNMLTYILVLAVAVCGVLSIMKKNKKILAIGILLALVAGVFFLLTKNFVVLSDDLANAYTKAGKSFSADENVSLGAGPIVGAICMFVSAVAGIGKLALDK